MATRRNNTQHAHRWAWGAVLLALPLLLAWLAWPVAQLRFNNDQWLERSHPQEQALDYLAQEFDSGESLLVVLELPAPFFRTPNLRALRILEEQLRALPGVLDTRSPLSATTLFSGAGRLEVRSFDNALETGLLASLEEYRAAFADSPYAGQLLSRDGRIAALQMRLDTRHQEQRRTQLLAAVRELLRGSESWAHATLAGDAVIKNTLNEQIRLELDRRLPLVALAVTLFLLFIQRHALRTLLILVCAGGCVLMALGWMVRLGHDFSAVSLVLVILISVIASADALHILARWDILSESPNPAHADPGRRLAAVVRTTWAPCLMASLTSAIGFGAFLLSDLLPLRHFGYDALLAILCAYPLIVLPCWGALALFPTLLRRRRRRQPRRKALGQALARLSLARPKATILLIVLPSLLLGAGLVRLYTETNFLAVFFAPQAPIHRPFALADAHLGGSSSIDLVLRQESAEHFTGMDALHTVHTLTEAAARLPHITGVDSYLLPLGVVHRAFGAPGALPQDAATLRQELLFLEWSRNERQRDVLAEYVDFDYRNARLHLRTPNLGSRELATVLAQLRELTARQGADYQPLLTGFGAFLHSLSELVLRTQLHSFLWTFALISLLLLLQFGLVLGSAGVLSNLLPLAATTGLIAWLGIPFDFATILVAGITLGLSVDDTIHFLYHYRRRRRSTGEDAVSHTLRTVGAPIVLVSALFCLGLAVLGTSQLVVLTRFAGFALFGILLSVATTLLLLPALLRLRP